jgi:hypothetical protein
MNKIFKNSVLIFSVLMGLATTALAADESTDTSNRTNDSGEVRHERSRGGVYFEPMLIYSQNDTLIRGSSQLPAGDSSGTVRDAGIGVRLGGHVGEIVLLSADARYGKSHFQDSFYQAADATTYNYGATIGVQTPVAGIQLFGTYILGGVFDPSAGAQNLDLKFQDARGYRVGAGIHVLSVSLNLEYQDLTYKNSTIESVGNLALNQNTNIDASQTGYAVSIGFPIEF